MTVLDNEVIGIDVLMKPKSDGLKWRDFAANLVLINKEKGNAFLYEFYELDGLVHLHERFKNAAAYKRHFDFFSNEVAEEFFDFFEIQKLEVYGNVNEDIREALGGMNAKFFSTVARF